jgi:hypothetical protein
MNTILIALIVLLIIYVMLNHFKSIKEKIIMFGEKTLEGGIANSRFQTYQDVDLTKIDYSKLSNTEFSNLITKAQDREDIVAIKNLGFRS